jgi:lysophospholipase
VTPRRPGAPLIARASGDGAVPALRAVETGTPVDALVLSSPRLGSGVTALSPVQALARRVGLGRLPAPGRRAWRRDGPDDAALGLTHDRWRARVRGAWELANPDLRVSGQSLGWRAAYAEAGHLALRDASQVQAPVLLLRPDGPGREADDLCRRLPRCEARRIAGARPALPLEADAWRRTWLDAIFARIAASATLPLLRAGGED